MKRDVITKSQNEGGLNMINIKHFITALKATWIRRLYRENSNWIYIFNTTFNMDQLANCGPQYIKLMSENAQNPFWKDVLKSWHATVIASKEYQNNTLSDPVWYNEHTQKLVRNQYFTEHGTRKEYSLCIISLKKTILCTLIKNLSTYTT